MQYILGENHANMNNPWDKLPLCCHSLITGYFHHLVVLSRLGEVPKPKLGKSARQLFIHPPEPPWQLPCSSTCWDAAAEQQQHRPLLPLLLLLPLLQVCCGCSFCCWARRQQQQQWRQQWRLEGAGAGRSHSSRPITKVTSQKAEGQQMHRMCLQTCMHCRPIGRQHQMQDVARWCDDVHFT